MTTQVLKAVATSCSRWNFLSASSSRNSVYYLRRFQWSWTFNILLANWTMRLRLSAVGLVLMKYLFHSKHLTEWEFLSLVCGFHVSLHESIRMMHSSYGNYLIEFQNHIFMGICLAFLEIWGRLIKGIRDHLKIWIGRCQDGTFQSKTSFQQTKKNSKNEYREVGELNMSSCFDFV